MIFLAWVVVVSPMGWLVSSALKGDKGSRVVLYAFTWFVALMYVVATLCAP